MLECGFKSRLGLEFFGFSEARCQVFSGNSSFLPVFVFIGSMVQPIIKLYKYDLKSVKLNG